MMILLVLMLMMVMMMMAPLQRDLFEFFWGEWFASVVVDSSVI